jgi:hypothetical protein
MTSSYRMIKKKKEKKNVVKSCIHFIIRAKKDKRMIDHIYL